MNIYEELKQELLGSLDELGSLLALGSDISGETVRLFENWEEKCESIRKQLMEELIRVAVVGSIKSGKSTFVNALLKGDYLKRGAGVVTSIVTKIRQGKKLRAKLFFKTWDEVNADVNQALTLLPDFSLQNGTEIFDNRRANDRQVLEKALAALAPEQLVANGAVDANSVLLQNYLKGYEKVRTMITTNHVTMDYTGRKFEQHWDFVSNDALAVYLKDIRLEIDSSALTDYFEIADCQGSDSPNPHHLAKIQDYLNQTHLIIYVISSRTGLRQADIRFLSMIKQMGIMENIMFVLNCDFNEHESAEDLQRLISKVKEDLAYIKPDHTLFTFSALLNLFRVEKRRVSLFGFGKKSLSEKDSKRLEQWESDKSLVTVSDRQNEEFESFLNQRLNREKYVLLLENHLERMRLMVSETTHWIHVNQAIMSRDEGQINEIALKIDTYRGSLEKIRNMVQHTLGGSVTKLKAGLRKDVDRLFEKSGEGIQDSIFQFIGNYDIRVDAFGPELEQMGFTNAMYRVYQEFKQAMDMHMAETVNPWVVRFVREKENEIYNELNGLVESYEVMIEDSLTEFDHSLAQVGIAPMAHTMSQKEAISLDTIKTIAAIHLPPAVAAFRYSAKIKTEAIMRLGLYQAVKVLKKVLKKPVRSDIERRKTALRDGGQRMKRETELSMRSHLKDYRENVKFQYFFKLADAVADALKDDTIHRFQAYAESLMGMIENVRTQKLDKTKSAGLLEDMQQRAAQIEGRFSKLDEGIRLLGEE